MFYGSNSFFDALCEHLQIIEIKDVAYEQNCTSSVESLFPPARFYHFQQKPYNSAQHVWD